MPVLQQLNIALNAVTLLVLLFILITWFYERRWDRRSILFLLMLLAAMPLTLSDLICWVFDGAAGSTASVIRWIANTAMYIFSYWSAIIYTHYLQEVVGRDLRKLAIYVKIVDISFIVAVAALAFSFTGDYYFYFENNCYVRGPYTFVSQIYTAVIVLCDTGIALFVSGITTRERVSLFSYSSLPLLAMIVQIFFFGFSAITYAATMLGLLLIFMNIHIQRNKYLIEKESEAQQAELSLVLSKIQPHFMFNSLNVIAALCSKDPLQARDAVEDFAGYLRGNLDSLAENIPVPFSRELQHTKHYLGLELRRFPDLHVIYDIQTEDFLIPTLALQPMVENAVKHGLRAKEGEGTLKIRTYEDEHNVYVSIEDDGVGFDVNQKKNDGRSHIGVDGVRLRVESLSKGHLDITSTIGKGTTSLITLPKSQNSC
ncbi:MAG: histidine kinase [Clostridia bacterium]|nr:histidine kinase [Clostridia bacterium]